MVKKRVYITWLHHHVLKEWYRYCEYGTQLLSFDYHTDFREAFCGEYSRTYPDERTVLCMTHGQFQTLKMLIRGAKAITMAKEPTYVFECSEGKLSSDVIVDWLCA